MFIHATPGTWGSLSGGCFNHLMNTPRSMVNGTAGSNSTSCGSSLVSDLHLMERVFRARR